MADLSGQVALVIGAASPLGMIAAQLIAEAGAFVAVNDWAPSAAEKVSAQLLEAGTAAKAYPADASKKLAFQSMLERLLEEHARIDLLINASAIAPQKSILELDAWDWRRALDLNLTSAFISMQSVGRVMRDLGGGTIIHVLASQDEAALKSTALASAIGALLAFSESARAEMSTHNIRVHALNIEVDLEKVRAELLPLCIK